MSMSMAEHDAGLIDAYQRSLGRHPSGSRQQKFERFSDSGRVHSESGTDQDQGAEKGEAATLMDGCRFGHLSSLDTSEYGL